MKKYYFALTNWSKTNAKTMLDVASKVSERMQDNDNFPNPAVPMTDFDKKAETLQRTYNNRRNGKVAKIELSNACVEMDTALRSQALYVTETSKGDNLIIETSGFDASKGDFTKAVVPEMPTNVRLESKNGNVCLITKKPLGASALCWVIYYGDVKDLVRVESNRLVVPMGVGAQIINGGKYREMLSGVEPGTKVTVQVLAYNAAGCSALSSTECIYVNK